LLFHYRHSFVLLFMLFFFAASFQTQAAQPTASDKEIGSEKTPYRGCTQESFMEDEFPTLALRVADKLKYSRKDIYKAICKAWPGDPSRSLVALVREVKAKGAESDHEEYDLDILVIKTKSGDILQHLSQKKEITSDAMNFEGVTFDTANYQLATGVRAFGVRISHLHRGGIEMASESLSLYVVQKNKLKPVLDGLTMSSSVWTMGGCMDDTRSTQRTLAIGNTSHQGYADLLLAAKNTQSFDGAKMIEKQWSSDYTLQYDGIKYGPLVGLF
jgi:hypothetical protein